MIKRIPASPSVAPSEALRDRAKALGLHGLFARWDELKEESWIERLLVCEEDERRRRSLERRIHNAKIGRFKPMADFEWGWPKEIDREQIEQLFELSFLDEAVNPVLVGSSGLGKTTIAQNLAYQALLRGHTVRFVTASALLNDLSEQESASALSRRIRRYVRPGLLVIDEVGYLAYSSRHADLLFEIVSRRHLEKSTVVTTNRIFKEWNQVFPNSSCVVALIDRLVQRSEVVKISGESYRLKEAQERNRRRQQAKKSSQPQRVKARGE